MSYQLKQSKRFARSYKKLHKNFLVEVNSAIEQVAENPKLGERKKGDLAQLLVYKFRAQNQLWLLGYTCDDEVKLVCLESLGSHENFYRDIKR